MLETGMKEANVGLHNIGDFVGFVKRRPAVVAPWYLVQIDVGSERTIADYLRRHGFEVYSPLTSVMKPVAQRHLSHRQRRHGTVVRRPAIVPLFPGYQFVGIDMHNSSWHDIFRLRHVRGLVCNADNPALVPNALIDNFRASEVDGVVPGKLMLTDVMTFDLGENVRLVEGPFAGFSAQIGELPKDYLEKLRTESIEELDESMRVTLLVSIFGRSTLAHVTLGQIEKV